MYKRPKRKRPKRLPKPIPFDLEKWLGKIALEWNYLEVVYHGLIRYYMFETPRDVADAALNAMSAQSKADFFELLIAKHETHKGLLEHLDHFRKIIQILTDNRNILQHSLPANDLRFAYEGVIFKRNRQGKPVPYKASEEGIIQIEADLRDARGYGHELQALRSAQISSRVTKTGALRKHPKRIDPFLDGWTACIEKPPLPHKLVPSPLGPTQKAG